MDSVTLAIVGSGGAGVVSLGELVLKASASVGYFGLMRKSFGPQIRGGESAAIIRLANHPIQNFSGEVHCLIALDWNNFNRFGDEIPVTENTLVIQDSQAGPTPLLVEVSNNISTLKFTETAESVGSSKANMALLGFMGGVLNCPVDHLEQLIKKRLHKLDAPLKNISVEAMKAGVLLNDTHEFALGFPMLDAATQSNWLATGNQLAGLGALESGVRFVAAYPITPASDCLEWIANHIEGVGGHLVQAEDELSAVNMIVGAGFAGVPCMTATSGPGLSLMSEAMGLAVASETPTVILNVMRGGPSTGIPTKSEQSDFNLAVYGMHGDAPHIVLSALSIKDCFYTMSWAVKLATELQTLVIVLSDQFIGQSMQIMEPLEQAPFQADTSNVVSEVDEGYARYLDTQSGVSPMAIPGVSQGMYTADGLEHSENAIPSPKVSDHQKQLDKRLRKLTQHDYGSRWGDVEGEGDHLVLCWGSIYPTALEAKDLLQAKGIQIKVVALRQLSPLPSEQLERLFSKTKFTLVVEQNHQAQFAHYLKSHDLAHSNFDVLAKPGPSLITPKEISTAVEKQINGEEGL